MAALPDGWQECGVSRHRAGCETHFSTSPGPCPERGCPGGEGLSPFGPRREKGWVGEGLAQFYLVCTVVGLVVEQWWGTDRQIILQRLAQQRVAPVTCKKETNVCMGLKKSQERPSPVLSPLLPLTLCCAHGPGELCEDREGAQPRADTVEVGDRRRRRGLGGGRDGAIQLGAGLGKGERQTAPALVTSPTPVSPP